MYYWLNVDFPTADAKLHVNTCRHAQTIEATRLKGIGRLKQDGGWLPFEEEALAAAFVKDKCRNIAMTRCAECLGGP